METSPKKTYKTELKRLEQRTITRIGNLTSALGIWLFMIFKSQTSLKLATSSYHPRHTPIDDIFHVTNQYRPKESKMSIKTSLTQQKANLKRNLTKSTKNNLKRRLVSFWVVFNKRWLLMRHQIKPKNVWFL